ncbi:hypothetical protein GACE_2214 [Geoglobus acetivorans]|uniref:Uncharacterized protein n=2 Tax=Geoglobus acetivorans TaxID=565033 RepID=A0A0A7GGQ1_GEOAI|nr:hypothetical protein GACE_2214 [Geoglobus acetivorans]
MELQRKFKVAYLFITHDVELAKLIADRIAIMHDGRVVKVVENNGGIKNADLLSETHTLSTF